MADFSNRVLLRRPRGAAHAPFHSSVKAEGPPPVAQLVAAGAGPRAVGAPPRVPGGFLRRDVLAQHHHPVVGDATDEAQASLLVLGLLPYAQHLKTCLVPRAS